MQVGPSAFFFMIPEMAVGSIVAMKKRHTATRIGTRWLLLLSLVVALGLQPSLWVQQRFPNHEIPQALQRGEPFPFIYDGRPARSFLSAWQKSERTRVLFQTEHSTRIVSYREPVTQLVVTQSVDLAHYVFNDAQHENTWDLL